METTKTLRPIIPPFPSRCTDTAVFLAQLEAAEQEALRVCEALNARAAATRERLRLLAAQLEFEEAAANEGAARLRTICAAREQAAHSASSQ